MSEVDTKKKSGRPNPGPATSAEGKITQPLPKQGWSYRPQNFGTTSWSTGYDGQRCVEELRDPCRIQVFRRGFRVLRKGQTLPDVALGGGSSSRTPISRVIVLYSAGAWSRASIARHVPRLATEPRRARNTAVRRAANRFDHNASIGRDQ